MDHTRLADGAAAASWVGYITAHVVAINPFLEAASFLIAIVSGIVAIIYHLKKISEMRE